MNVRAGGRSAVQQIDVETRHKKKEDQQAVQQLYMFYTHLISFKEELDKRSIERSLITLLFLNGWTTFMLL